jgi:hypothetical protein
MYNHVKPGTCEPYAEGKFLGAATPGPSFFFFFFFFVTDIILLYI